MAIAMIGVMRDATLRMREAALTRAGHVSGLACGDQLTIWSGIRDAISKNPLISYNSLFSASKACWKRLSSGSLNSFASALMLVLR